MVLTLPSVRFSVYLCYVGVFVRFGSGIGTYFRFYQWVVLLQFSAAVIYTPLLALHFVLGRFVGGLQTDTNYLPAGFRFSTFLSVCRPDCVVLLLASL